ncbi:MULTISPECIES: peptidoglycan-associated lipoprotein Pal [Thalassotalea]|uniref:Peptidoglycan-associated lipoprotein n=1 Tax=Thalassotalea castellviae TaxID=3075612 RepID=A0ABU3A0Q9_9GAMM|nr:peptidoglycan-associated lipoprotein Pal [Thalassotalea sp. W431]MDT0602551.1 peptidoglycan-associated lipoprotein Pal [Thalassotalea sp. W431]
MRLNKTVKALAIALPMMALAACSSNSETDEQSQVDTNAQTQTSTEQNNVQVTAAQRAAEIEEQKRQEIERLRSEHIVYFDFDKSSVSGEFSAILDAHAKFLNENSNVSVLVEGHADERGTPEYNIALGERRAKAVVTYLENMGVASSQLTVVSYGEEKPMVKDRSESAFAKNRRAVLVY